MDTQNRDREERSRMDTQSRDGEGRQCIDRAAESWVLGYNVYIQAAA